MSSRIFSNSKLNYELEKECIVKRNSLIKEDYFIEGGNFINSSQYEYESGFFHIQDNNNTYYGGNQYWYAKLWHRQSGCGPTVAANITVDMARKHQGKYRELYPYDLNKINKNDFIIHMKTVHKYVTPGIFGLTSVKTFSENVRAYAKSCSLKLDADIHSEIFSLEKAFSFIKNAFKKQHSLALLILTNKSSSLGDYTWHWMNITGYRVNVETGDVGLVIATWGEKRVISLNLICQRSIFNKAHIVYFY